MISEPLRHFARMVPYGSVPWFDLLDTMGLLEKWCRSDVQDARNTVLRLILEPRVLKERGDRIADIIKPSIEKGGAIREDMLHVFRFTDFARSPKLVHLFLDLIEIGAFDRIEKGDELYLHGFAKINPSMASHVIGRVLDRECRLAKDQGQKSPFAKREGPSVMHLPEDMIGDASHGDPISFAEQIVPRIAQIIVESGYQTKDGETLDRAFAYRSFSMHQSFKDSLLTSASISLARLAALDPDALDRITLPLADLPHENIACLLLAGWGGNTERYSNRMIDYLLADSHRLSLGYSIWSAGDGVLAISRAAIEKATERCSDEQLFRLESSLLNFFPEREKKDPRAHGYCQYVLLSAVPERRLSSPALTRLREWERKFPGYKFEKPYLTESGGFVESPIPKPSAQKMSDPNWLDAMRKYGVERKSPAKRGDWRKGSGIELSRILESEAREDKPRFAALALQMKEDIPGFYFEALLRGLSSERDRRVPPVETKEKVESLINDEVFNAVIEHVHAVAGNTVGRWICDAIANHSEHEIPPSLLDLVSNYAISDPDPTEDSWSKTGEGSKFYGGDPLTEGINTTRGSAAHAIAYLLFADKARLPSLRKAVDSLTVDSSVSVRAVALESHTAILNVDRDLAVSLFLKSVEPDEAIWASHTVDQFLHYAIYTHYPALRSLLKRMLSFKSDDVREMAAQSIALAAFSVEEAREDLAFVLQLDGVCRAAVAKVDASNYQEAHCREMSRERLLSFFKDDEKLVRDHAAGVLKELDSKLLLSENTLVEAFIESPAFESHVHSLIDALEKSDQKLPSLVCRIADKAVALQAKSSSAHRWWTNDIGTLVLRLYDQARDPALKKKCLDLIDQMIVLGFGNIDTVLDKIERS